MVKRNSCIAMLLAGGQGSRLGKMTKNLAKPAVPFGGKYRIIDFTLSNCCNSEIYTVGVLTQYQPLELHTYIGIGGSWDLDRKQGGVFILPPFEREGGGNWYKGTADAIYQNIKFIDSMNTDHVLVLSGDHIYKMNYANLLEFHLGKNADASIAVIDVPIEEASRFGIMNTDETDRIIEFQEKPKKPKSTLASMGVYVFHWQVLRKYLIDDSKNEQSTHDFGKDIIPKMLSCKEKLFAYPFKGYWRDVGTIESYWQASMDLLGDEPLFELDDPEWIISSGSLSLAPQYIGKTAKITNSLITEGCRINGTIENSILFPYVVVEKGAKIKDSIIMARSHISGNTSINKAIVRYNTYVMEKQKLGTSARGGKITVHG